MRHRETKELVHSHTRPGKYYMAVRSVHCWRIYQYLKNSYAFESYTCKSKFSLQLSHLYFGPQEKLLPFPMYGKGVSAFPSTLLTPFQGRGKTYQIGEIEKKA